jgi:hypothetical protein
VNTYQKGNIMQIFTNEGHDMSASRDVGEQAARGAIPMMASIVTYFAAIPLDSYLVILTLIYTLLQIFVLTRDRIYRPWKSNRQIANAAPPSSPDNSNGAT